MPRIHHAIAIALIAVVALSGCDRPAEQQADDSVADEPVADDESADDTTDDQAAPLELDAELREAALTDPDEVTDQAPDEYRVEFQTTAGTIVIDIHRQWAPRGADRLFNLVRIGFFEDVAFFRVVDDFMAQFGLHGDPEVNQAWLRATIADDDVTRSNERGKLTFATSGPDSRSTQLFINLNDNSRLDSMGFSPVGEVVEGMDVAEALYSGYGESAPEGQGPMQDRLRQEGNDYLRDEFEDLDYITNATVIDSSHH